MRFDRAAAAALVLLASAAPLRAQDAPSSITPETEVRSIGFRFDSTETLGTDKLREQVALTERGGMVGLRKVFGFLPFIPPVGEHPFNPLELQRDVIRLRHLYQQSGFLHANVNYEVQVQRQAGSDRRHLRDRRGPTHAGPLDRLCRGRRKAARDSPATRPGAGPSLTEFERKEPVRMGEVELQGIAATNRPVVPVARISLRGRPSRMVSWTPPATAPT